MAPHSSTLAWKIPWMDKPGRLQSMGSLRVRHDWGLHFHFSLSCIGEGNGNPLQCSCLENPRDGGAWWAAVYGVSQSRTWLKRLSGSILLSFYSFYELFPRKISVRPLDCCLNPLRTHLLRGCLPAMQETWVWSLGQEDPLEKGMATYSSILAWRIPWTEEPGGLQSVGSETDTTEQLTLSLLSLVEEDEDWA